MLGATDIELRYKPNVPVGCKVISWFLIIGSAIVSLQYLYRPIPIAIKYSMFGAAILIMVLASLTLRGSKIGLIAFAVLLIAIGISISIADYINNKITPNYMVIIMSILFYLLPSIYLLSKRKLYSRVNSMGKNDNNIIDVIPSEDNTINISNDKIISECQINSVTICVKCGNNNFIYDSYYDEYTCNKCGYITDKNTINKLAPAKQERYCYHCGEDLYGSNTLQKLYIEKCPKCGYTQ